MKVMFVDYPLITKEGQGRVVAEKIRYTFHDKKVLIETSMFPSPLQVELQGKDPDSLEHLSEVWDFNTLHDGVIDFATIETIFYHIPVVDVFIENGELHIKLYQNKDNCQTTDEWLEVKEEPFSIGNSIKTAKFEWSTDEDLFELQKEMKKEELRQLCEEAIQGGFYLNGRKYSYGIENQQNFSDTMRLFDNNMIDSIGWNAYVNEEKVRIQLNKKEFTGVYLAGVQHKTNAISRLNDVLYPLVDTAENKETVARIYWDEGLPVEELSIKNENSIENWVKDLNDKTEELEQVDRTLMMAVMQVSGLLGGF